MIRFLLLTLLIAAIPISANASNLVVNGSFEDAVVDTKTEFAGAVANWNGGNKLTYIARPGTADVEGKAPLYGPFPSTSPDGGNFVIQDGDPAYSDSIWQRIDGLRVGATYQLTFYQAAGQWQGFDVPTTERWKVSFGDDTRYSDQCALAPHGVGVWGQQKMSFTAQATSQILAFLASGTPAGGPPMVLLDGVSLSMSAVPEPSTWAMMIGGLTLVGGVLRIRRPGARRNGDRPVRA